MYLYRCCVAYLERRCLWLAHCEVADSTEHFSKALLTFAASRPVLPHQMCATGRGLPQIQIWLPVPCSTLAGGSCTTATCCSKTCVGFGDCGAEALVSTPASTSCGSAGDDCGDLSWRQCFDLFCVKRFVRILLGCRCVLESASFDTLTSPSFWGVLGEKKWTMYIYTHLFDAKWKDSQCLEGGANALWMIKWYSY